MSGIINNAQPAASDQQPGQTSKLDNPLLQQVENQIETNLTPQNRANYMKIVVSGLHIALDKGADGFMAKLHNSKDPIADCANGAVSLLLIMRQMTKGMPLPMKAGIPAAMTLMLHGLDFIDRAGLAKIGEAELVRATHIFASTLFGKLRITSGMLQNSMVRVHQIMQDPDAMAAINLKAGITRHPMAATPTPLPAA